MSFKYPPLHFGMPPSVDSNNLAILDFNEHDVNVLYTCHYGFEQYSKNLTLDNGNFKSTYLFELFLFILLFYNPSTSFKMHREILSIIFQLDF
jgi:hypothetical protein